MTLLLFCLLFPLFGALVLLFVPSWNYKLIRSIALYISLETFLLSLCIWIQFLSHRDVMTLLAKYDLTFFM